MEPRRNFDWEKRMKKKKMVTTELEFSSTFRANDELNLLPMDEFLIPVGVQLL